MLLRIGLPFWRGETRMVEGALREGRAWGVGCWILGVVVEVDLEEGVGWFRSIASTAAVKSASSP